ncbi:MAG: cyclic nucleotide-binding domain-containing protein [Candidatus Binatia bacterium]
MRPLLQRLRRALGVEPGEGSIVAWSAGALFLIESASVAVSNVSDTLFLKRVGLEYLPMIFLANSVLLTATTLVAARVAIRFDPRRLLYGTFVVLATLLFLLWVLVVGAAPGIATTLVILSKQIDVIALLLFWTVVSALMSSRQSKRLVALMTAGGTLGTIAGSFASGPIGRLLGIPSLLGIAALTFAAAAVVSVPLSRSAPLRVYRGGSSPLPEQAPRLREFWQESSLFRVLVGTSFLAGVLGPMLYFEFSRAADLATRGADGEQRLLALYGQLRGWINVGVLAVQIGVSALIFRRVGVPLAAALAPLAYLFGFAGLAMRFGLTTAMPAAMSTSVIDHTVYEPALRILGSLLPQRVRTAATSFIQGPSKRAGAAFGSLIVLAVVAAGDPSGVSLAALPVAAMWFLLAMTLWRNYPNLLLETASVRRTEADDDEATVAFLDAGTLRTLQRNLEGSDAGLCRAACALFVDAPHGVAVETLARAIPRAPSANRGILIEALDRVLADAHATDSTDASLMARIVHALESASGLGGIERAKLLQVLGRACVGHHVSAEVRAVLERACAEEVEVVRTVARIAGVRAGVREASARSVDDVLAVALSSQDMAVRSLAVAELRFELLRDAGDERTRVRRLTLVADQIAVLAPLVRGADEDGNAELQDRLRSEVVGLLADVAVDYPATVQPFGRIVLSLVDDDNPAVRSAVLRFIGNAGLPGHSILLAARLSSGNAQEAAAARGALENLGPRAADALLHALRHGGRRAREVIPGMLRDMRSDPAVLRALIDREIESSRELMVLLGVLDAAGSSRLVLQRLRERIDEGMHCVLELLAAILEEDRIANVCRTLGRSWNIRDRAVLLEALETLLPAAESARILPLLEDHSVQRLGAAAARDLGRDWPTLEEALAQVLSSQDLLTIALVVATTERSVLASVAPSLDVDATQQVFLQGTHDAAPGVKAVATAAPQESVMLSPVEKMLHLRTLDTFQGLTTRQLSELARVVTEVKFADGKDIVVEGEFEDSMYFIVSGKVRIVREGSLVAELGERDFFGEMAVFDGETRSATAKATGDVRVLRLARNDLFDVMEDQPAIGIGICQILVRRLRNLLAERASQPPEPAKD